MNAVTGSSVDLIAVLAKAQQCLLRIGRHQRAILGEDVYTTKAAAVRQHRTVLTKQQPAIGAEWPVKLDGVGGNGRGERRAVTGVVETFQGT